MRILIKKSKSSIFYNLVLPLLLVLILLISGLSIITTISFLLLLISIHFLLVTTINLDYTSITNVSIIVFSYLFLFIAPIFQLSIRGEDVIINTLPVDSLLIFYSNLLISIFFITYTIFYKGFKTKTFKKNIGLEQVLNNNLNKLSLNKIFLILVVFLVIFLPTAINDLTSKINPLDGFNEIENNSEIFNLFTKKFLYITPLLCAIAAYYNKSKNKIFKFFVFSLACLTLIFFKNPIVEHRNGFGIPYLVLFICVFPRFIKSNLKFLNFLFFTMIFLFPLGSFLAPHRDKKDTIYEEFLNLFNTVHFDAWANFTASIDYVRNEGLQWGEQIISTLGFWIPREIWVDKGVATGILLGDYLIEKYSFWFNNISLVFPAEGYIDFGLLGLLVYSIILAFISTKIDLNITSGTKSVMMFSLFISFSYIFLFRGPLLSSLAFSLGGAFAFYFFMKLVGLKLKIK